jgi:hypothetical protein
VGASRSRRVLYPLALSTVLVRDGMRAQGSQPYLGPRALVSRGSAT